MLESRAITPLSCTARKDGRGGGANQGHCPAAAQWLRSVRTRFAVRFVGLLVNAQVARATVPAGSSCLWDFVCRVTSAGAQRYRSEKVLTDEGVKELLATSIKKERKKKPRKKKDDASGEAQEVQGEAQEAQGE